MTRRATVEMDLEKDTADLENPTGRPDLIKNSSSPLCNASILTGLMARGDEAAYRFFFEQYYHRLFRYQIVVCHGNEDQAREALQSTFLRVVRHIRRFDSEEVFWSWLTVLARSAAKDEQRKQQRQISFWSRFFKSQPQNEEAPDVEADEQLTALLEKHLKQLPESDRVLVEEKYLNCQSVKSIALKAQASEKAIDSRLVRLRKKLKAAILAELKNEKRE